MFFGANAGCKYISNYVYLHRKLVLSSSLGRCKCISNYIYLHQKLAKEYKGACCKYTTNYIYLHPNPHKYITAI